METCVSAPPALELHGPRGLPIAKARCEVDTGHPRPMGLRRAALMVNGLTCRLHAALPEAMGAARAACNAVRATSGGGLLEGGFCGVELRSGTYLALLDIGALPHGARGARLPPSLCRPPSRSPEYRIRRTFCFCQCLRRSDELWAGRFSCTANGRCTPLAAARPSMRRLVLAGLQAGSLACCPCCLPCLSAPPCHPSAPLPHLPANSQPPGGTP